MMDFFGASWGELILTVIGIGGGGAVALAGWAVRVTTKLLGDIRNEIKCLRVEVRSDLQAVWSHVGSQQSKIHGIDVRLSRIEGHVERHENEGRSIHE